MATRVTGLAARGKEHLMEKHAFWTRRRFTGVTLIIGCFLFLGAAGVVPKDNQGNFMVNLPLREQLLLIAAHTALFQWSFSLFISGIMVTLLGLAMLSELCWEASDHTFSMLALIAALFGDVLMVIYFAAPLGIAPAAATSTVSTGVIPDYYVPFTLWTQPLFVIATILAFAALAAYGAAILATRILPNWVGWVAMVYALAGLALTIFAAGNAPPFLHYLLPIVMGIALLLPEKPEKPEKALGSN
jgi:hypothetical protein